MKRDRGRESRAHGRFPFAAQFKASQLSPAGTPRARPGMLRGETENISTGGVCVRTDRPLKSSHLVRCELRLPGVPVRIPLLARVQWTEKRSTARQYLNGLQFVV